MGLETIAFFLGVGLLAGVAAGFIGIGGGVIMVPVLIEVFRARGVPNEVLVHVAMGTSLAVATFSSLSSAIRHHKQGNVIWKVVPILAPTSFVAGWVAGATAQYVPGLALQRGLAVVLLLAAVRMLLEKKGPDQAMKQLPWWGWTLMGLGTGLFSGFTGLAGGMFLIPLMAYVAHVPTKRLAGTSSGVVLFTAFAAALGKLMTTPAVSPGPGFVGYVNLLVALSLVVTSIPGAQLGAYLNKKAGSVVYKRIFAVVLLFVVVRLFLTS